MEQIAYGYLKEAVTAMVHSVNDDTNVFENVKGDASYQFIICLDYVLRRSINLTKVNGITLKKKKKKTRIRRYSSDTVKYKLYRYICSNRIRVA